MKMGADSSIPATAEDALAAGFTQEQISEYQASRPAPRSRRTNSKKKDAEAGPATRNPAPMKKASQRKRPPRNKPTATLAASASEPVITGKENPLAWLESPSLPKSKEDDDLPMYGGRANQTDRVPTSPLLGIENAWSDFGSWVRRADAGTKPDTPKTRFLSQCEEMNLIPEPLLKRVAEDCTTGEFSIENYAVGDHVLKALAESIGMMGLRVVNVADNRGKDPGITAILLQLQDTVEELSLSKNKLGRSSLRNLSAHLSKPACMLTTLRLEGTGLNDVGVQQIATPLATENTSLTHLNLSHNRIGDQGARAMANALAKNGIIKELDLSWNQIGWNGGVALAKALASSTLESCDLSWNALGSSTDPERACAASLSRALKANTSLEHADISHNQFTAADLGEIGRGLQENHTLMGLHCEGNALCDARGFIEAVDTDDRHSRGEWQENVGEAAHCGVFTRILKRRVRGREKWAPVSNCWICEKWREKRFVWRCKKSMPTDNDGEGSPAAKPKKPAEVLLSASFDKWQSQKMAFVRAANEFEVYRMVPPGRVQYFYYVDGIPTHAADDKLIERVACRPLVLGRPTYGIPPADAPEMLNEYVAEENDDDGIELKPRVVEAVSPVRKTVVAWKFKDSVFAQYRQDTAKVLEDSFNKDWDQTRLPNHSLLKNDPEQLELLKQTLKENFSVFKDVFKHYAAAYTKQIFNLGENAFSEVLAAGQVLEDVEKGCNRTEATMEFITVNTIGPKNQNLNPKRALCRFQFVELFTRLAITKFFKSGKCESPAEAAKMMVDDCLSKAERDRGQEFREDRLYNQECDETFKANMDRINRIFKKFSGKENRPSEKKTMSFMEWTSLLECTGVLDGDIIGDRMCRLCFVRAQQTSLDEMADDFFHRKMDSVEFMEGIARLGHARLTSTPDAEETPANMATAISAVIDQLASALFPGRRRPT